MLLSLYLQVSDSLSSSQLHSSTCSPPPPWLAITHSEYTLEQFLVHICWKCLGSGKGVMVLAGIELTFLIEDLGSLMKIVVITHHTPVF